MSKSTDNKEPVLIGKIVGAFGLRGQVKVEPLTNIPDRFSVGATILLDDEPRKVVESRLFKGRYILRIEGLKKIEEAEKLQWKLLYALADDVPELDDDEYMVDDLIGLKVMTTDGVTIGKVDEILTFPAHDVLVVGEVMIPAIQEFVEMIDFDEETITVRLIDGMLEANKP